MTNAIRTPKSQFCTRIKTILQQARDTAYKHVNFIMVEAYWHIGQQIVEEEQKGEDRAKYGSYLIKELSERLTADFGKGFSKQSLWNMKQFYQAFPILSTLWRELSWSHYKYNIRLQDKKAKIENKKELHPIPRILIKNNIISYRIFKNNIRRKLAYDLR